MLNQYFEDILKTFRSGNTTEPSFYPDLKNFIERFSKSKGIPINITIQPKRTEAGTSPDFIVRRNEQLVGYIEAKDIGENLEHLKPTFQPQIERYKKDFDNFILTNYFDFWLWRRSEKRWILKTNISKGPLICLKENQTPSITNEESFFNLIETFLKFGIPERKSAKLLAEELAIKAKLIPKHIIDEINDNNININGIYEVFKKYLITDLSKESFADIYAQTITYGLFMARLKYQGKNFSRFLAQEYLPKNIKILNEIFFLISGLNLPKSINWIIDDITTNLANADIEKIKKELHQKTGGDDPLIHFYETFLKEYNPKEKEQRGVYYTPLPIVSYITRSINILLKEEFEKSEGFANKDVTLLDPCSGTLTFPVNAIRIAKEEIDKGPIAGAWSDIIKNHILKNYYAFELLMAPYIIGHLKISLLLEDLGYEFKNSDRFPLYLTNTLDLSEIEQTTIPYIAGLSEEAREAMKVKKNIPILIIMGNPPYLGISKNVGIWITNLIEDYKYVDGKHFGEKKHWLQDDYVKFIRFAQWKIDQAGKGILGFITNHSYLDNPTFRGMRQSLMNSFNEIYILDLHGNSLKKEKCPDSSKDENVFDIQQGVAIAFFIKKKEKKECIIYHSDLWGLREEKYNWLSKNNIKITNWKKLNPTSPYYFFIPREEKGREIYEKYWKITDIFPVNSTGIVTARDKFVIDFDKQSLKTNINIFIDKKNTDDYIKEFLKGILSRKKVEGVENYAWRVSVARQDLYKVENLENYFIKILYRPFDIREIFFHDSVVWRTRKEVMRHMMNENLGLLVCRQQSITGFYHAFVSEKIVESCVVSNKTREISYLYPLYLYPKTNKQNMFRYLESNKRKPNINPELIKSLTISYDKELTSEEIFYYIYAVLYSNIYRTKYAEFLKIDFPKIPFTKDAKLFYKIAELGKKLVYLHLLKSEKLEKIIAKFPISTGDILTDGKVKKNKYNLKEKRIYINDKQYFEGVELEIWNYQIGGYQVLSKWLKDRAGRKLSLEDITHYLKIITALSWTIKIQEVIDKLYPEIEKSLIK
jgi:hypothetical protein